MVGSPVARKRSTQCRTKVKTGCATCRKVKCDESKPFCQKCVGTGRACDGYESPFRLITGQNNARSPNSAAGLQLVQSSVTEIAPQDVQLLNRYFSTKTMCDVMLGCDDEAKQILQAGLTDPTIRHAVSSLKALREHLEASEAGVDSMVQRNPSDGQEFGLQQYCMALGGLAAKLASPRSDGLKSALLCCQVFISIEQVRGNYAAMAQHMIHGLSVMQEYRARPCSVVGSKTVPTSPDKLATLLDVFIVKLFAAPCKFADPSPAATDASGTTVVASPVSTSSHQGSVEARSPRAIAPDMRTEITRIATATLQFLNKVSQAESVDDALRLQGVKSLLLDSLDSWLVDLEIVLADIRASGPEPISMSFLRFFHQILRVVLLGALDFSPNLYDGLQTETDSVRQVAVNIDARLKAFKLSSGPNKNDWGLSAKSPS